MFYSWTDLKNSRYMQYICVLTAALSVGCSQTSTSWVSISIPKLTSDNSPIGIKLNSLQASWVVSIATLGFIPGSIVAGLLSDRLGRKYLIFIAVAILFVCWIAIPFAKLAELLITIRFIYGIASGVIMMVVPIYMGEIADTDVRGRLGVTYNILSISGNVFVLCIGPFVSYNVLTFCCAGLNFLVLVVSFTLPESPYYLIRRGDTDGGKTVLRRLLQNNVDESNIENRFNEMKRFVTIDMKTQLNFWKIISTINYRKSFLIVLGISISLKPEVLGLKVLQTFSGYSSIRSYLQTIIESSGSSISPEISNIAFGAVQLPAVLLAAAIIDKMGRKPLLLISTIGCSVMLIAEGVYFYLESVYVNTNSISWLPTTGLCLYLIILALGITTIPPVMVGEIFSHHVKSVFQTVIVCFYSLLSFATIIFFEPMISTWGMHTVFWIYALICILGCFFIAIYIPETKGKSFIDIQNKLRN